MKIIGLEVGLMASNCYIVYDEETREAIVVDPGADGKRIMAEIERNKLQVKYIVNTHGHSDHIMANRYVHNATGAKLLIHALDAQMLTSAKSNLSAFMGESISGPAADGHLQEGESIKFGNSELRVLHTPGHTPGGICLIGEKIVLSGDTLFQFSIGRCDFPGGSYKELLNSINTKLMTLSDDYIVYPGHGPLTTIGQERQGNPFLR